MQVAPHSVRIDRDPISGHLFYHTFEGELYEVQLSEAGEPKSVKVATSDDHGITRLQGMVFYDSTLYLVGNIRVNDGRGTKGRLVRGRLGPNGERIWSNMFMTEEYGSTATTYDHGFNGITVSADGRYLYINSGARTDHGEVQDNNGEYPGSRDVPLTTAIFRIPTNAQDLLLPNDLEKLQEEGYLFARGIRNGFDLAFGPKGHLFCVSNSGDYDHPEDMFWIREGHHYGFPWVMGNVENPQQYPDFEPDPEKYPLLNPRYHAFLMGYFHNDPTFPEKPAGVEFTPPIANVGPDANYFRDPETGEIIDGDEVGVAVGTFTAHSSPLGLFFDVDSVLAPPFRGDGFVLRHSRGDPSGMMGRLPPQGSDLLHLELSYAPSFDNYVVQTTRLVEGFNGPADAEMVGNVVYVIEYGEEAGNLWKLTFPSGASAGRSSDVPSGPSKK